MLGRFWVILTYIPAISPCYLPAESCSVCSALCVSSGWFSLGHTLIVHPHGPSCLIGTSSFLYLFLLNLMFCLPHSPVQSQALSFYYSVRDYWGTFFTAHRSVQCLCLVCSLILGHKTQHLYTKCTWPIPTQPLIPGSTLGGVHL